MHQPHQLQSAPSCTKVNQLPLECTKLHETAPICTMLDQSAPCWTNLHQVEPNCNMLHQSAPSCIKLHQPAPNFTKVHQVVPIWTKLHQTAPGYWHQSDTLRKANHKSEGKSSTIGCQKVTNQGAELKSIIWRFRHSSYVVLLFDKRMAEARCLNQSFEFGSAERLSLLLDLILREQLTSTVVCIIYGCQRSTSWRHVYKHTFCIQTYILDWTSPLGLFRNNNSLVLMPDRMQILFHECDYV